MLTLKQINGTMTSLTDITALLDSALRIKDIKDAPVALNGLQVENNGCVTKVALAVDGSQKTIDDAIAAGVHFYQVAKLDTFLRYKSETLQGNTKSAKGQ